MSTIVIVLICVGAAALILLSTIRVVKESTVAIVERNGRFKRVLHPGVRFVLPILDKIAKRVSTKQYMVDFPAQFATTKNGVTIKVGVLANLQIIDPKLFVYEVENPREMTERFLFDFLRKNIAALPLRELFIKQGIIDNRVRTRLNAVTKKWGVRVNNIMLHNIEIPRAINDTLQENFAIEYEKRGKIMRAQANRVAMMTEAEGQAKAIKRIVSSKPNREYITLKSMEMLERLSTGGAATFDAPKNLDDVSEFVEKVSSGKALTLINKSPEIRESKADKAEAPSVDEFARQALGVEKSLERNSRQNKARKNPKIWRTRQRVAPKVRARLKVMSIRQQARVIVKTRKIRGQITSAMTAKKRKKMLAALLNSTRAKFGISAVMTPR